MALAIDTLRQINAITELLIETGLCVEQNFPSSAQRSSRTGAITEVTIPGMAQASIALKGYDYEQTYETLRRNRAFNLRLVDGALVQFSYQFNKENLVKHILGFYPSPGLPSYDDYAVLYENEGLYADLVDRSIVKAPVRFDYDPSSANDVVHPASHFTIGQYANCRIPTVGALTPHRFIQFVLSAFYSKTARDMNIEIGKRPTDFPATITLEEQDHVHIHFVAQVKRPQSKKRSTKRKQS